MTHAPPRWVFVAALMVVAVAIAPMLPGRSGTADALPAATVDGRTTVRLMAMDGVTTTGVISATGGASWNGSAGYAALKAERVSGGQYRVSASTLRACPGAEGLDVPGGQISRGASGDNVSRLQAVLGTLGYDVGPVDGQFGQMTEDGVRAFQAAEGLSVDGTWKNADADRARQLLSEIGSDSWTELGTAAGPVTFTSSGSETSLDPGDTLGLCRPNGQVVHYRGSITAVTDGDGTARTVNELSVENYLRGVVPREVSPSWGNAGGGAGMNALRAQAVGARSYALSQDRYSYAKTCDSTACQAYGGSATRTGAAANHQPMEHALTDQAIRETAGKVRVWPDGSLVSTEYSASNGPYTAGGAFPSVDDVGGDSVPQNPNHQWTRVIPAAALSDHYQVGALVNATNPTSSSLVNQGFVGVWADNVRIQGQSATRVETAWNFRNAFNLPAPGFSFRTVESRPSTASFAFIGDSVGTGIDASLRALTAGSYASAHFDSLSSRQVSGGGANSGVAAAGRVPQGTDLVVVQLGYNNRANASNFAGQINAMMTALESRGVGHVQWVNLSTRHSAGGSDYTQINAALNTAASNRSNLTVLDWNAQSAGAQKNRWFTDGVHLTATGHAELAAFVSEQARTRTQSSATGADGSLQAVIVDGIGFGHGRGMSQWGAYGWAVNHGWEWTQILDHYYGGTSMGDVAVSGDRMPVVDQKVTPSQRLEVDVAGVAGVPEDAVAVAMNVTAVEPEAPGYLTVWPCGSPMPEASNVNFASAGGAEPNAVLVQLDATGKVCIYTYAPTHAIVDLAGWFTDGFEPVVPQRIADTRGTAGPVSVDEPLRVQVAGVAGVPDGAAAVAMNVTAVEPGAPGYLTVWPCGSPMPEASNVNYAGGGAEPNAVLMQLDDTGEVCIYTYASSHVLVDLAGWFTAGFEPMVPRRITDTRSGLGTPGGAAGVVTPAGPLEVQVAGVAGVPEDAVAVAMNVTAVEPEAPGYLTVWPCGSPMPEASNVNYAGGGAEPNAVLMQLDDTGKVCIYTYASSHVLVDLAGSFTAGFQPIVPNRIVDTRSGLGR